jgi:AcrR family transcriptional regulator
MDARDRILAAAVAAFQQEGLEGLSMRRVAARVGLTPMALYRHYADKQALIDAVTLHALEAWRGRLARVRAEGDLQWLDAMSEAFLDFALEEPRLFEAAFRIPAGSARRFPEDFTAGRSPPGVLIFRRIEAAKQAGLIGDAPTAEIALSIWAMAQGLIDLYRAGRFSGDETAFRALYRSALRRCVSAFRPQEQAWTP